MDDPHNAKITLDNAAPGAERILGATFEHKIITDAIYFGEGPTWDPVRKQLYFSDIVGDTIYKWQPGGKPEPLLRPSRKANGTTLDREGRLVVAGWGGRTVFRIEHDGSITTLADRWQGKKLNTPNDIIVHSTGWIYFSDSAGGLYNVGMVVDDLQKYLDDQFVFRVSPDGKKLEVVTGDFIYPNGMCFSPDEKVFYVNCARERLIRAYDAKPDGSVGPGRVFHAYDPKHPDYGAPDGLKCDVEGRIYCTGPGGIWVHNPDGAVVGRINMGGLHIKNMCFGDDDWRTLYVATLGSVVSFRVNTPGLPSGRQL